MSNKANSKINLVMENAMPNEELEHTKTNSNQDTEETNVNLYSIPPSPTCTETSLSNFSNLSISIPEELSDLKNKKIKAKSEGSNKSFHYKFKALDTLSEKAESIYNLRKSVRNPITGEVTKISAAPPQSNTVSKTDNIAGVASNSKENGALKTDKVGVLRCNIKLLDIVRPQLEIYRNPITGEGIDSTYFPTNVKNYKRSGIRINQPPGGMSNGIF